MSEPGPLLLEQRTQTDDDVFVRRITAGGDVYVWSSLPRDDGEHGHPEWQHRGTLAPAALDRLRAVIGEVGFMDLPAEPQSPVRVFGGSDEIRTVELDGRTHTVTVHGSPGFMLPEITRLDAAIEDAL